MQAAAALERSQKELLELGAAADVAREQDKNRIARELHDELGQALTMLQMDVAWCKEKLPAGEDAFARRLDKMAGLLTGTVAATRRIAADLRPLVLDDLGLLPAVESLVENFRQRTGIPCELAVSNPEMQLPAAHSTAVFRVVQEALTNVAKHAQAKHVEVAIEQHPTEVTLNIRDDGRGFAPQKPRNAGSFGLIGLRERAYLIGGDATITSAPGQGTSIELRLPIRPEEVAAMIRVLVADDHTILREGLKQLLLAAGDLAVVGEARDGFEVLEQVRALDFDVLLLDMSMPGKSGVDLIKQVKAEKPKLRILILSMHQERQYAVRAIKAGASGYLTKESAATLLVSAIRKVAGGGAFISAEVAEELALGAMPHSEGPPHTTLSDREYQVFRMLVAGHDRHRHRGAAQPVGQDRQHAQGPADGKAERRQPDRAHPLRAQASAARRLRRTGLSRVRVGRPLPEPRVGPTPEFRHSPRPLSGPPDR